MPSVGEKEVEPLARHFGVDGGLPIGQVWKTVRSDYAGIVELRPVGQGIYYLLSEPVFPPVNGHKTIVNGVHSGLMAGIEMGVGFPGCGFFWAQQTPQRRPSQEAAD